MSGVLTVLIVDDSRLSRMMIRAFITQAHPDWTIIEASNGQEAIEKTATQTVDLMTIDLNMPGMDGFEMCKRVRAMPHHEKTPIIFVTSHTHFDNRIHSVVSGGNELISKPIFPIELAVKAATHWLKSQLPQAT